MIACLNIYNGAEPRETADFSAFDAQMEVD